jgi:hypothetical protein
VNSSAEVGLGNGCDLIPINWKFSKLVVQCSGSAEVRMRLPSRYRKDTSHGTILGPASWEKQERGPLASLVFPTAKEPYLG